MFFNKFAEHWGYKWQDRMLELSAFRKRSRLNEALKLQKEQGENMFNGQIRIPTLSDKPVEARIK